MATNDVYLGNPNLKKAGTPIQFTKKQVQEWIKCKKDPIYFATHYIKIISLDEGLVPFDMYDFQKRILQDFHENRFFLKKIEVRIDGFKNDCKAQTKNQYSKNTTVKNDTTKVVELIELLNFPPVTPRYQFCNDVL